MAEAQQAQGASPAPVSGVAIEPSAFDQALKKAFKPKTDTASAEVNSAVRTLVEIALKDGKLISPDVMETIEAMIGQLDKKLTEQINKIIHHPEFQKLEGTWRGLHHLVFHTETDESLKIRVFNASKKDLGDTFRKFPGVKWDQSPLFKKIYEAEYGQYGGTPYGVLVGDYEFDHSAPDVDILKGMSHIAAASHAPFLAAADPGLLDLDSWQDLSKPRDLTKIFETDDYARWRSLRESEDARYLGLTCPRFLARMPYGAKTNPVDGFDFEEECEGTNHAKYTWANSAFAMATNITQAFKYYGWCSCIRGPQNGTVTDLPVHTFPTDDGGVDMKCPTEIAITDRREGELDKNGLMALVHKKSTDKAAFFGAASLQKPAEFQDPDATANARLSASLPYLFAMCRFAHFLKVIVREKIGTFQERADMERWLHNWIQNYVEPDPKASQEAKAKRPLAKAEVQVLEVPGKPGYYSAKVWLRPHYQLEGLTADLSLVSKVPKEKKGG